MSGDSGVKHLCPNCNTKLENVQTKHGVVWSCFSCKGRAIGVGLLQKISDPKLISQIWVKAQAEKRAVGKSCPSCRRPMLVVATGPQLGSVELDICHRCFFIWFDNSELEKVPRASEAEIEKRTADSRPKPSSTYAGGAAGNDYFDDDDGVFDIADLLMSWLRWR